MTELLERFDREVVGSGRHLEKRIDLWQGWLRMACFGLGTVPLVVLAGSGGSPLSISNRQRLLRLAAICVVVTRLISLARSVVALQPPGANAAQTCPLCR